MPDLNLPTSDFPWTTMSIDLSKVKALTQSLVDAHVTYGLGAKISPLSLQAPGLQNASVDCSGFVRWVVYHATAGKLIIPDGSSNQHSWFNDHDFKISSPESCELHDDVIRIAFLNPEDGAHHIGHVVFVANGVCYESHGHHGPDNTRNFDASNTWMKECHVYVVTQP